MLRFRIRLVLLLLGLPALFVSACTTIATPAYRGLYSTSVQNAITNDTDASALINLKPGEILRYRLGKNNDLHDLVYNKTPTESIHLLKDDS